MVSPIIFGFLGEASFFIPSYSNSFPWVRIFRPNLFSGRLINPTFGGKVVPIIPFKRSLWDFLILGGLGPLFWTRGFPRVWGRGAIPLPGGAFGELLWGSLALIWGRGSKGSRGFLPKFLDGVLLSLPKGRVGFGPFQYFLLASGDAGPKGWASPGG